MVDKKRELKRRINDLKKEILFHRQKYYNNDPQIPDKVYDELKDELRNLMDEYRKIRMMNLIKIRKIIGKIIIITILLFSIYRCLIKPPIYYKLGGIRTHKPYRSYQAPIVDFYKLLSELIGLGILGAAVYWLLLKDNKE